MPLMLTSALGHIDTLNSETCASLGGRKGHTVLVTSPPEQASWVTQSGGGRWQDVCSEPSSAGN